MHHGAQSRRERFQYATLACTLHALDSLCRFFKQRLQELPTSLDDESHCGDIGRKKTF
jgi:uncharacterized protein YciW